MKVFFPLPCPMQHLLRTTLCVLALAAATSAQELDRHPVTESYGLGSPELTSTFEPADVVVVNTDHSSGGGAQWLTAELGLLSGHELDAFSDGSDFYPSIGPAITPPADCRIVVVEQTPDPSASGLPGSFVESQALGNGAASDTFSFTFAGSTTGTPEHSSDHLEVTPLPGTQTDLDALGWYEEKRYPVYFSVDRDTALALGVSPADVLISFGSGAPPTIAWSAAELGLVPDDDVDAISVNTAGGPPPPSPDGIVVYSLAPDSPSLAGPTVFAPYGPGALFVPISSGGVLPWATSEQLDLKGPGAPGGPDNLNGVRISDPIPPFLCDPDQPDVDGTPYDLIRCNGSDGGAQRIVDVQLFQPFTLTFTPQNAGDVYVIWAWPGRPCQGDALNAPQLMGPLAFNVLAVPIFLVEVNPFQLPNVQLPGQAEATLQGVVLNLSGGPILRTNALTVRVR